MFSRIFYSAILIFLLSGPKAFSASFCEDFFSKTASFIRGESGAVRWKFWQKPPSPPPTDILTELRRKSTNVESSIHAYNARMLNYNESHLETHYESVFDIPELNNFQRGIGASYYWGRYVPRQLKGYEEKSANERGKFIIGFGIFVKGQEGSPRLGHWYHRIHWDSGARGKELDQETVRQIFTEIYGGQPEIVVTEISDEIY